MSLIVESAPNFSSKQEMDKWLNGKMSRAELIADLEGIKDINKKIAGALAMVAKQVNASNDLMNDMGLKLETLIRLQFGEDRKTFEEHVEKTRGFATFISTFLPPDGINLTKPILEKLEMIQLWNSNADNPKIDKDIIGLKEAIEKGELTPTDEDSQLWQLQFNFTLDPLAKMEDTSGESSDNLTIEADTDDNEKGGSDSDSGD